MLFELFYRWHRTFPDKLRYGIIMYNNVKHRKFVTIGSTSIFCTNDIIYREIWRHLPSLSYLLSIFEDVGGGGGGRGGWHPGRKSKLINKKEKKKSFGGIRPLPASKSIFVDLTTFEFRDRGVSLTSRATFIAFIWGRHLALSIGE